MTKRKPTTRPRPERRDLKRRAVRDTLAAAYVTLSEVDYDLAAWRAEISA